MNNKKLKMNSVLEASGITTDKYYNMKQFINIVRDYVQTKTEDSANLLNRHLQLISVTIDLSSFDPHTFIVAEFFVSLHELLSFVEPSSPLAWCTVNVLGAACRNAAARTALMHTYQFVPLLSKLLEDNLKIETKIKVLNLLQELTCGIQIQWQISHLSHLISTLTRWIEHGEEEVVGLSLAILVNLCYKNLPAVYTLSRCMDIKKFVRICMPLKGLKIEIHVCKLLIILDYMNGKVPEKVVLKLIEVTFKSLLEGFKARDFILLRHVIELFLDTWDQNNHSRVLQNFKNYDFEIDCLVSELENACGDAMSDNNAQCMSLLFKFLDFVIKLRQPDLPAFDSRLVNLTSKWIQVDFVCPNALDLLHTVALNTTEETCMVLDPFLTSLPILLLDIENGDDQVPTNIENNKRLSSLMELLRALMKNETTRNRILTVLKEDVFTKIFIPLLGGLSPESRASDINTYSSEAIALYVNSIALIHVLLKYDHRWTGYFNDLMQRKQIHMTVAQALYYGSKKTKALILSLSSEQQFPTTEVSAAMCELQPTQSDSTVPTNDSRSKMDNLSFPMMSVTEIKRLDEIIDKTKEALEQNSLVNVSTADIMELYEYKLATMNHAERAALASVEAASLRCTHLQQRTAQLNAELSRLRQLLLHTQQSHEDNMKTKEAVLSNNKKLQEWLDTEKNRYSSELSENKKIISEKTQLLEETNKRLKEIDELRNVAEEKLSELKRVATKLEDSVVKKDKLLEKKEDMLLRANGTIESLKSQVSDLEKRVKLIDSELAARTRELTETSKELQNCKSIIGTITQLTSSQFAKHS